MEIPQLVFFEDEHWKNFVPLTYVRAVQDLRCGFGSLSERTQRLWSAEFAETDGLEPSRCDQVCNYATRSFPYLGRSASAVHEAVSTGPKFHVNGRVHWESFRELEWNESWIATSSDGRELIALYDQGDLDPRPTPEILECPSRWSELYGGLTQRKISQQASLIRWPWELLLYNQKDLTADFEKFVGGDKGQLFTSNVSEFGPHVTHVGGGDLAVAKTARIKPFVVFDTSEGPIRIGDGVTIYPHTYLQGPLAVDEKTIVKSGACLLEGTSIGPRCKVGGEIEATIFQGFSNKQHDGFLGHGLVGEWVNLAADCVNSDLKNTYGTIRVPIRGEEQETNQRFVGSIIGDFSKIGINVGLPTGAVIGFCSSVVGGMSPKFIPSFCWYDGGQSRRFLARKGLEIAAIVMERRERTMNDDFAKQFLELEQRSRELENQALFSD